MHFIYRTVLSMTLLPADRGFHIFIAAVAEYLLKSLDSLFLDRKCLSIIW